MKSTLTVIIVWLLACVLQGDDIRLKADEEFILGPFKTEILPVPFELDFAPQEGEFIVMELDLEGKISKKYPSCIVHGKILFVPFPLPGGKKWLPGKKRRFIVKKTEDRLIPEAPLKIERNGNDLKIENKNYSVVFKIPEKPGSAKKLIYSIAVPGVEKTLNPPQLVTDLPFGEKRFGWQFDKPPFFTEKIYGNGQAVQLNFKGSFKKGSEFPDGILWSMLMTFYSELPLIKVRFVRKNSSGVKFNFGRVFQVYFNSLEKRPFASNILRKDGKKNLRCPVAVAGKGFMFAIIAPQGRVRPLGYISPDKKWGYLCGSWEGGSLAFSGAEDVREFYLLISPDTELKDQLATYRDSLNIIKDANWFLRINKILRNNK